MKQSLLSALYISFIAVAAATQGGCGSPLVGLECENGYAQCGDGCYDPDSDPNHCGGCGISCASDEMCVSGSCTDDFDGSTAPRDDGGDGGNGDGDASDGDDDAGDDSGFPDPGDGGMDAEVDGGDGGDGDGGVGDGSVGDGTIGDGGDTDGQTPADGGFPDVDLPPLCTGAGSPPDCVCELGELLCEESCVNPQIDTVNCGACGNDCTMLPPENGQYFCVGGVCRLDCDDPYTLCSGACVDTDSDPANCGFCGNTCESGLCEMGLCLDATAGHVIVIGHDLSSASNTAAVRRIAQNAMFLPPRPTVRGLIYREFSTPAAAGGVSNVINSLTGRSFELVGGPGGASSDDVPFLLSQSDVFVIVSQANATDVVLQDRGDKWARALRAFVRRGGVIVLFDGGGTHAGTHQILQQAGLFSASVRTPLSSRQVNVEAPGDAVASLVPMRYQTQAETVGYTANDGTVVVRDRLTGLSVVIHIAR